MNVSHVDPDLSALLDGELAAAELLRVEAHLASCSRCRDRLAELRSTASLVSSLPAARPARSLVPRIERSWEWLRPVRSVSAFASGAFLFVSLATAIAQSGAGLSGGAAQLATGATAAPFAFSGAASGAPPQDSKDSKDAKVAVGPAAQATAVPPQAPAPGASVERQDTQPSAEAAARGNFQAEPPQRSPLANPVIWLALTLAAGAVALLSHRRLRAKAA